MWIIQVCCLVTLWMIQVYCMVLVDNTGSLILGDMIKVCCSLSLRMILVCCLVTFWTIQFSCLVTLWMIQVPWYLATRYRFVACCHWEWYWFVAWCHFWWYRFVALWHWTIQDCCLLTLRMIQVTCPLCDCGCGFCLGCDCYTWYLLPWFIYHPSPCILTTQQQVLL